MKKIPNGKGWFIWQIKRVYGGDPVQIVKAAKAQHVSWVSIKICDRGSSYNLRPVLSIFGVVIAWKDDIIQPLVDALRAEGIAVYGWGYAYLDNGWGVLPAKEAAIAVARVKQFGLDGFFVDAEGQAAKQFKNAQAYIQALRDGLQDIAIGLCSFRFPSLQTDFPWRELLAGCDFHAPQVYWIKADNSADQLTRSFNELTGLVNLPFVPLGIAAQDDNSPWKPTMSQIDAFAERAQNMGIQAVGWYEWGDAQAAGLEAYVAMLPGAGDVVDNPAPTPGPVVVAPSAPIHAPAAVGVNLILSDMEVAVANGLPVNYHSRTRLPEFSHIPGGETVATVGLTGGEGNVEYPAPWIAYLKTRNGQKWDFFTGPNAGIHNAGDEGNVRQVTCESNYVQVLRIDGDKAYVRVYAKTDRVPTTRNPVLEHIMIAVTIDDKLDLIKGGVYYVLMANAGESLWIPVSMLTQATFTVQVNVNIRQGPSISAARIAGYAKGDKVNILQVETDGPNLWGRTALGWFALRYNGQLMTDWRI